MDLRSLVVVILAASVATAGAALPSLGDAGSGDDAGDDPGNATLLADPGTYEGTLFPPGDTDWYKLPLGSNGALCAQANVYGTVHATGVLALNAGLNPAVERPVEPGLTLDLGIATPSTMQVLLGLEAPDGTQPVDATIGTYRFDLTTFNRSTLGDGDAGTGEDAGSNRSTAIATEGPCIGGTLENTSDSDVYVFDGIEGEHVAMSLAQGASGPVVVNLTAPSGFRKAQVGDGDFTDVTLNETGEWLVRADLPGQNNVTAGDYILGLTVNGPEPRPCKPSCFSMMG